MKNKHHLHPMNQQNFRRGSVLIMVVALLVLLALMGTAWIATSRQERDASVQNLQNEQIASKANAIPTAVADAVTRGLLVTPSDNINGFLPTFVPRNSYYERYNYAPGVAYAFNYSVANSINDQLIRSDVNPPGYPGLRPHPSQLTQYQFLAARTPTWDYVNQRPLWPAISAPLVSAMPPAQLNDNPTDYLSALRKWDFLANDLSLYKSSSYAYLGNSARYFESPDSGFKYLQRENLIPSYDENLNPVFLFRLPDGTILTRSDGKPVTVLAADTDGDGVADAGLARIPVAESDGITWYAAIRILDANSAFNVSVAGAPFEYAYNKADNTIIKSPNISNIFSLLNPYETVSIKKWFEDGTPWGNFYPTNIDLASHLGDGMGYALDDLVKLNRFRINSSDWNIDSTGAMVNSLLAATDLGGIDFKGNTFSFKTPWELFWRQIGARTNFPGALPGNGMVRYQSFPESDDVMLLKHFLLPPQDLSKAGVVGQVLNIPATPTHPLTNPILWNARKNPGNPGSLAPYTPYIGYKNDSGMEKAIVSQWFSENFRIYNWPVDPVWKSLYDTGHEYIYNNSIAPDGITNLGYSRLPLFVTRNGTSTAAPMVNLAHLDPANPSANTAYLKEYFNAPPALPPSRDAKGNVIKDSKGNISNINYDFPVKANINTADFPHLWNAFWHVMAEDTRPSTLSQPVTLVPSAGNPGDTTPFSFIPPRPRETQDKKKSILTYLDPIYADNNRARMFRSSLRAVRDPTDIADIGHETTTNARINSAEDVCQRNYMRYRFLPQQMVMLRSAIAAVNAIQMRSHSNFSTYIQLRLAGGIDAMVEIYGVFPQPVIGEVYVENNGVSLYDGTGNPNGYIAVGLYNPYPFDIPLAGWKIAAAKRTLGNGIVYTPINTTDFECIYKDPEKPSDPPKKIPAVVPAGGWLIFENYDASGKDKTTKRPYSLREPNAVDRSFNFENATQSNTVFVKDLSKFISGENGQELILLKPGTVDKRVVDVPVDTYDFTGFPPVVTYDLNSPTEQYAMSWHYRRNCDGFKCFYPGKFDGSKGYKEDKPRQEATEINPFYKVTQFQDVLDPNSGLPTGAHTNEVVDLTALNLSDDIHNYFSQNARLTVISSFPPIQLANTNQPSASINDPPPYNVASAFFGGFARNGDIMNVPFIGSYVVRSGPTILEMNPVTMDCFFAEDGDPNDNANEDIGRFSPMVASAPYDLSPDPTQWRYHFANRLFDYLSVETPGDDTLMGAPIDAMPPPLGPTPFTPASVDGMEEIRRKYGDDGKLRDPNDTNITTDRSKLAGRHTGVNGLININTAPLAVLESIPFFTWHDVYFYDEAETDPTKKVKFQAIRVNSYLNNLGMYSSTDTNFQANILDRMLNSDNPVLFLNRLMAQSIITYREGGPSIRYLMGVPDPEVVNTQYYVSPTGTFNSILDLYKVPQFRGCAMVLKDSNPNYYDGDLSPDISDSNPIDGVRGDCEERHLFFTRISNLVTTRSDRFYGWIVIQGWKNAGTPAATLVNQRRMGVIIDRNNLAPKTVTSRGESQPNVTIVPLPVGQFNDSK